MTEVTSAADQASILAGSGQQGLARMEDTMHSVMGAADLVNAKIGDPAGAAAVSVTLLAASLLILIGMRIAGRDRRKEAA